MKKVDISKLNKHRSEFMKLSFIIALGLVTLAFNWTSFPQPEEEIPIVYDEVLEEIPVVRTPPQKQKTLPPPILTPSEKIIEEEPEFIEKLEPEPVEAVIEVPETAKVVERPKPVVIEKTPAPPKPVELPKEDDGPGEILIFTDEMPRFKSDCEDQDLEKSELKMCAQQAMLQFIYSKVKYPAMARENGVEGTAVVSFVVERDGSISNIKIMRDPGAGLGREAKRVATLLKDWIPGKQRFRPVRVQFNLPVKFQLDK